MKTVALKDIQEKVKMMLDNVGTIVGWDQEGVIALKLLWFAIRDDLHKYDVEGPEDPDISGDIGPSLKPE